MNSNSLHAKRRNGETRVNLRFSGSGHAKPENGETEKNPLGFSVSPFRGGRRVSGSIK